MRADRRAVAASACAVAASAGFLAWLATGFGGPAEVKVVDNLGLAAAAVLAALACAPAAWRERARVRTGWALLGAACASWAVGEAIWAWYELVAGREVPFPSVADAAFLSAVPLIGAAMLCFARGDEPAVLRARALLDGGIIAVALLYASWALVLGPVFRARVGGAFEQVISLLYPVGDVVVATAVFLVLGRRARVPLLRLGAALLCITAADSAFAYYVQTGEYFSGFVTDTGWFAGFLLIAAAALWPGALHVRAARDQGDGERVLLPYAPLGLALGVSIGQQLGGRPAGPFLYWSFLVLVLLIVGRQLLTLLDNQALNRELVGMVGRLEHQAFYDPLTGLANRALFRDRLEHELALRRREPRPLAVMLLDLDDFKQVNDTLGHAAGDALLVAVAGRLRDSVRGEDTVARLGGDEFAILLEGRGDPDALAARVVASMQAPVELAGATVRVTASVGVAAGDGGDTMEDLLHRADLAMYRAKAGGKDRFERFGDPRGQLRQR